MLEPPEKPALGSRSERKRAAIIGAAAEVFLRDGYAGASMDDISARSGVSKQTVYKHFSSKEELFNAVLTTMMGAADTAVHKGLPAVADAEELRAYLEDYGVRLLTIALTPELMQLRRLVIAEAIRFPDLARQLYTRGAGRAVEAMAGALARLADKDLLRLTDPATAASQLNWLLMGEPVNRIMMLGNEAIPTKAEIRRHVDAAVATFLAAFCPDKI